MISPPSLEETIAAARVEGRNILFEMEALPLLERLGIRSPRHEFIPAGANLEDASAHAAAAIPGDRVVIKVIAPDILHKSDVGGVRFVEKTPAAIAGACRSMREALSRFDLRGFLVSEQISYDRSLGGELLLGIRSTVDFGPIVTFGAGGTATELLARTLAPGREIAAFSPHATGQTTIDAILATKAVTAFATGSARGERQRISPDDLRQLVERALDVAASSFPLLAEVEINPLVATERGLFALDALIRIGEEQPAAMPPRPLAKIANLLHPASVAVVGVSRAMNPGRIIVSNLLREGFDRDRIFVVKPGEDSVDRCPAVPDLASLPQTVDLLVLSIAAEQVPDVIDEAVRLQKAESIIVIPGGLGERAGSENIEERVRETIRVARGTPWSGPVVNGGNCLGVRSRPARCDTMFLPDYKLRPPAGATSDREVPLAIVSQSGAFAVAKATTIAPLRPRYLISIGNQIDLTVGDYMEAFERDASLELFAFYVEGFRPGDGLRWLQAATRAVASGRPVILYLAGRTPAGASASASHTAAIAGDAVVARELCRAGSIVLAETLADFEDLVRLFSLLRERTAKGNRIAAMSNAGFESVAFADALGDLRLAPLSAATRERLSQIVGASRLDRIVTISNPLDVNPLMSDRPFVESFRAMLEQPETDLGLLGCVPLTGSLQTLPAGAGHAEDIESDESVVTLLGELWRTTSKPWAVVVDSGSLYDPMVARLGSFGVPTFRSADRAMKLLGTWSAVISSYPSGCG